MITVCPGSHTASLVASSLAERRASKPSRDVKPRQGLTTELPARFRRPIIMRCAQRAV